jgi:phosphoenolpyruvate carboxykinase (ATP)
MRPGMATTESRTGLAVHGIEATGTVHWNPSTSQLYTDAIARGEGRIVEGGPLAVDTGKHTGRSPRDKFVVREPASEERIWWGDVNAEISEEHFEGLREKVTAHIGAAGDLYVIDAFAGADPKQRIAVRVVTNYPYHALFARTMFIDPTEEELRDFQPVALVLHAPGFESDPATDGTRSGTFIVLHPSREEVLIGGTFYAGEIKKSIFTLMNDRLPLEGVFPMHCSANLGDEGDVAIFFGLSGTG